MPYCSSEQKLAGYDEHTTEIESEDVSTDTVDLTVLIERPCSGCSSTAATGYVEISIPIEHECQAEPPEGEDDTDPEYELEGSFDAEPTDRSDPGRCGRRYLGASVSGQVRCLVCDEVIDVTGEGEDMASSFWPENH